MLQQGQTSAFSGAMASPITKLVRSIQVVVAAQFTVLQFQFPTGESQEADPTTVTFPVGFLTLKEVKSFQLASGSILVHFAHTQP